MSDFWTVSAGALPECTSLSEAVALKASLEAHVPDVAFTLYRCKRSLHRAEHFPKLVDLLRDILDAGVLTDDLALRARLLLFTIGNRSRYRSAVMRNVQRPEFHSERCPR